MQNLESKADYSHSLQNKSDNNKYLLLFSFSIIIGIISLINITSIFSFIFFFLLLIILNKVLGLNSTKKLSWIFLFYTFIAIMLFVLQMLTNPSYFGFSGGLGVGTDDSYYYSKAVPLEDIPNGFPLRDTFFLRSSIPGYSEILRVFSGLFSLFTVIHPIDLLFFNVLVLSFIPIFTGKVAEIILKDTKVSDLAYKLSLFCPILITNGLVLVRDGFTATLFVGSMYFLLKRNYLALITSILLMFHLRVSSGALLLLILIPMMLFMIKKVNTISAAKKGLITYTFIIILSLSFITMILPILSNFLVKEGLLGNLFYREDYQESFLAQSGDSVLSTIGNLPAIIRIPLGFVFFFCSPFFSINAFYNNGLYIPRGFISMLFPILFLFYVKYFFQGIVYEFKSRKLNFIKIFFLVFLVDILLLSQLSLQLRHKTMIMPLFYILVAYGSTYKTKLGTLLGNTAFFFLVLVQLVYLILSFG